MTHIKHKLALIVSFVVLTVFSSVSIAAAYTSPTKYIFDAKNGTDPIVISLDDNTPMASVPEGPKAPEGKLFLGWARQEVGQQYPEIIYWSDEHATLGTLDGGTHFYFAMYANLQPAKMYPYINTGFLSEQTSGYAERISGDGWLNDSYASDYYTVQLTAGTKYYFQGSMPGREPNMHLFDSDYKIVSDSSTPGTVDKFGHAYDLLIEYTPAKSGTYYLKYSADSFDEMGPYQLIVSTEKVAVPKYDVEWCSAGKVVRTDSYDAGEKIVVPTISRKGYTFKGWYKDVSFTKAVGTDGEEMMPVAHIAFFAKWTSNESHLKRVSASNGTYIHKVSKTRYVNHLRISKKKSTVTLRPVRVSTKSTVYMKYKGGTYKKVSSLKVHLKKGQTKTVYIKCVSQTGSKYKSTYRIDVKRNK